MAKPILVVKLGINIPPERREEQAKRLAERIGHEYHVFFILTQSEKDIEIECFNDCKGLADVDIEKLIKEINA